MSMAKSISRRRMIFISAAACGLPILSSSAGANSGQDVVTWRGQALGATATFILNHPDRSRTERLIRHVVAEVQRLEAIFSLYQEGSALSQLNRFGALAMPPGELVTVLKASSTVWQATAGLFDPTIQPLWTLYASHFAGPKAEVSGPPQIEIERALALISLEHVHFNQDRIAFAIPGMALTLNGIAQGYITDRVVALLGDAGIENTLVDMGETRAIGYRNDGRAWQVGLAETQSGASSDTVIPLVNQAIATSSFSGYRFDAKGRFGHILHPGKAITEPSYRRLTTICADATTADAYSTAMSLMDINEIRATVAQFSDMKVDLVTNSGEHLQIG